MPATPLNAAARFSALSGLEIVYVPVVAASTGIPTRAEIDAGTDLTSEVMEWSGFTVTSQTIDTPDLTRFVGKIPGRIESEDSQLMIYADRGGDDVRDVLPRDTVGFLVWLDDGDTAAGATPPAKLMDIFPVQVNSLAKVRSMEAATMLRIDMSMTRIPVEDVPVPAQAA